MRLDDLQLLTTGPALLAADRRGELDRLLLQLDELLLEGHPFGAAWRVVQVCLVDRRGNNRESVHDPILPRRRRWGEHCSRAVAICGASLRRQARPAARRAPQRQRFGLGRLPAGISGGLLGRALLRGRVAFFAVGRGLLAPRLLSSCRRCGLLRRLLRVPLGGPDWPASSRAQRPVLLRRLPLSSLTSAVPTPSPRRAARALRGRCGSGWGSKSARESMYDSAATSCFFTSMSSAGTATLLRVGHIMVCHQRRRAHAAAPGSPSYARHLDQSAFRPGHRAAGRRLAPTLSG